MKRGIQNRNQAQSGQATTEYILLLMMALIISLTLIKGLFGSIDRSILGFGGALERQLKTGRAPVSIYVN